MAEHTQDVRDGTPPLSVREAVTRLRAILRECAEDDEKRKLYFGYFKTSRGDL